jgi:hypothetical protein
MKYKTIVIIILALFNLTNIAQNKIKNNTINFKKNAIYLIGKGSKSKSKLIAENFNIKDKNITHVGIGFVKKNELIIYHVIDGNKQKNALKINTLNEFIKTEDIYYLGIWEYKTNKNNMSILKKKCNLFKNRHITFDYFFTISNDNNLYCSEFCYNILKMVDKKEFNIKPTKKILNEFYSNVLNRDSITYFPVDFFQKNKKFKLIFENNFNKNQTR